MLKYIGLRLVGGYEKRCVIQFWSLTLLSWPADVELEIELSHFYGVPSERGGVPSDALRLSLMPESW